MSKSEGFITVIPFFPVIIRWYYKTQAYATKEAMSKYQNFEFKNQKYIIIC